VPPKPPPGLLSLKHLCLHMLSDWTRTSFADRHAASILGELDLMFHNDLGGTTCEATKALYAPVRGRLCMGKISHENRVESQKRLESENRAEEERAHKDAEAVRLRREAEAAAEAWEEADACAYENRRRAEVARLEARLESVSLAPSLAPASSPKPQCLQASLSVAEAARPGAPRLSLMQLLQRSSPRPPPPHAASTPPPHAASTPPPPHRAAAASSDLRPPGAPAPRADGQDESDEEEDTDTEETREAEEPGASSYATPDLGADADGWAPFDEVQLANGLAAAASWIDMAAADPSLEIARLSEEGWEEMACFEIVSDATDYVNTHGRVCRSAREVRERIQHAQRQFGTTQAALADFERDANRRAHRAEAAACAAAAACTAVPAAAAASSSPATASSSPTAASSNPAAASSNPAAASSNPAAASSRPAAARPIAVLPSAKRPCPNPFANPFAAGPRAAASLPAVHRAVPTPECLPPAVQCCFAPRAPRAPPQRHAAATGGRARGARQRRTQWSGREERALCGCTAKEPFGRSRPCGHPTAQEAHPLAQGGPLGPRGGGPSPPDECRGGAALALWCVPRHASAPAPFADGTAYDRPGATPWPSATMATGMGYCATRGGRTCCRGGTGNN
jgi:hypothetical protein